MARTYLKAGTLTGAAALVLSTASLLAPGAAAAGTTSWKPWTTYNTSSQNVGKYASSSALNAKCANSTNANAANPNQTLAVTANMPTLNINTIDSSKSLTWVEKNTGNATTQHTNRAPVQMSLVDPTNAANYIAPPVAAPDSNKAATDPVNLPATDPDSATYEELKGRGNHTWMLLKKPYQIKFNSKVNVLGMGAAKTWILLANDDDDTLMRDKIAYDFAKAIGLPGSPDSRWVDLCIDGVYHGTYQISEKDEIKENRLELWVDPSATKKKINKQAVIAEMDNNYGSYEIPSIRTTIDGSTFVLKDGNDVPDTGAITDADTLTGWNAMKDKLAQLNTALRQGDPDWTTISNLIDVDSFVKYYFVAEMFENPEVVASSVYFYMNGPNDKIHAGPVWDFDSALWNYSPENVGGDPKSDYVKNAAQLRKAQRSNYSNTWYSDIFRNKEFVQAANTAWLNGIGGTAATIPGAINTYYTALQSSAANNYTVWKFFGTSTHLSVNYGGKNFASSFSKARDNILNNAITRVNFLASEYGNVPVLTSRAWVFRNPGSSQSNWMPYVNSGQILGTTGESRPMRGFQFTISNYAGYTGGVEVRTNSGSWTGWNSNAASGVVLGNVNNDKSKTPALLGVQMRLTGDLANKFDIQYRSHLSKLGWQPWVKNGSTTGVLKSANPFEAFQIRLLAKDGTNPLPSNGTSIVQLTPAGTPPTPSASPSPSASASASASPSASASASPSASASASASDSPSASASATASESASASPSAESSPTATQTPADVASATYSAHVAHTGWMSSVADGATAGAVGQQVQALRLSVSSDYAGGISWRGHVQSIGWQGWTSGNQIGTTGKGLRLEAFQLKLTGDLAAHYTVQYRAYLHGKGWQGWASDGSTAGTTGQKLQIDAVQIKLIAK